MNLTVRPEWMQPGYEPRDIVDSPFVELPCTPRWEAHIEALLEMTAPGSRRTSHTSLEAYAAELVGQVEAILRTIRTPHVHVLLSGGFDSRLVTALLERLGMQPLVVTDGMEEPSCTVAMDAIGVPPERRYVHDMTVPDPYGLAAATCEGFAPLYSQLRFTPPGDHRDVTLVTGLGGGEWFSYPASGWLRGKHRRLGGDDLASMWLDCWPQYPLIVDAWERGYGDAVHPFCELPYAHAADECRPEWVQETPGRPELDLVRAAMLAHVDERLLDIPWMPHRYDWNLGAAAADAIDSRYRASRVFELFHEPEWGMPSQMDAADHACKLAGFATWCDLLEQRGHLIVWPS